ncbi:MAG: helix-turn-helix transcriptional regulator [Rikenellaceae bacterium]
MNKRPTIIRLSSSQNSGIESIDLARNAIGYVLRGEKRIYESDSAISVKRGEVFFLSCARHYVENIAPAGSTYEEISFYISEVDAQSIITNFDVRFSFSASCGHRCEKCDGAPHLSYQPWPMLSSFFEAVNIYISNEGYIQDPSCEQIKLSELIYLIVSSDDNCLKSRILQSIDRSRANFEQVIYSNIFSPLSIDELALMCNRSLTSFKKEFKRIYNQPPHQWFLHQRLSHSRMLLVHSSEPVSQIGSKCAFPNTSHFIKLFKRYYGDTPASFRSHSVVR